MLPQGILDVVRFRTCGTAEEQQNSPKKPAKYTEKNSNQRRRTGRTRKHVQKTIRKARKKQKVTIKNQKN